MTAASTELIPKVTVEKISGLRMDFDANHVERYVASKFRRRYQGARENALNAHRDKQKEANEAANEATDIVKADAEKRLVSKIASLVTGFGKWGSTLKTTVTTELTSQKEGEGKRAKTVYGTYVATASVQIEQSRGDKEEDRRYGGGKESFTLTLDLKYPSRATTLLKKRDEAEAAASHAYNVAMTLKQEEASKMQDARDTVSESMLENFMQSQEGGDLLTEQLDGLVDSLVGDVDAAVQLKLEGPG